VSGSDIYNEKLPFPYIEFINQPRKINKSHDKIYEKQMYKYNKKVNDEKLLPLFVTFDEILPTKVASIGFCKRGVTFIPIDCEMNDNINAAFYQYTTGIPIIAKLKDINFPIQYLGLLDISPERVIQPENNLIFEEIAWIDKIWTGQEQHKYVHK
jgi:hypothetical protein